MKYLCLVYGDEDAMRAHPDRDCMDYVETLVESGHFVAGEALQPVHTATTVRVRNGKPSVTDGPFAETREQLAGFYLVRGAGPQRSDPGGRKNPARARGQHRSAPDPATATVMCGAVFVTHVDDPRQGPGHD